jgi:hypothetical protein
VAPSVEPFVAVSGWDCGIDANHGFDVSGRTGDWYTVATGGWAEDGCHGDFEAIPMSGKATDDPNQYAVWWFNPGPGHSRCALSVYGPKSDRQQDSAARAAQFSVLAGRGGAPMASVALDQTVDRGSWKTLGTFPVSQNGIALRLGNRGVPGASGDRLAVSQVRASCVS